jgi:hypothetical protein
MSKWTDEELAELEDPETWDWESAEEHPPVQTPGARVPVRFSAAELGVLERAAEQAGLKLTAYVRAAALARAQSGAVPEPPHSRGR